MSGRERERTERNRGISEAQVFLTPVLLRVCCSLSRVTYSTPVDVNVCVCVCCGDESPHGRVVSGGEERCPW